MSANWNKLSIKHQSYPQSRKLDAFKQKICNVTALFMGLEFYPNFRDVFRGRLGGQKITVGGTLPVRGKPPLPTNTKDCCCRLGEMWTTSLWQARYFFLLVTINLWWSGKRNSTLNTVFFFWKNYLSWKYMQRSSDE